MTFCHDRILGTGQRSDQLRASERVVFWIYSEYPIEDSKSIREESVTIREQNPVDSANNQYDQ